MRREGSVCSGAELWGMLRLRVSRTVVAIESPRRRAHSTRAIVALMVERGRVGIVAVGEDESEIRERLEREPVTEGLRGVARQIVAAAQSQMQKRGPALRFVAAGDDPWWDEKWKNPYSLRDGDPARAQSPREVLLVEPLSPKSWSPHLIRGLLMYVLWTSPWTQGRTWPAFRRPKVELVASDDIEGTDYAELVDQLRSLWGQNRVALPADRAVGPIPTTPLRAAYQVSRPLWWTSLVIAIALSQPEPGPAAIAAGIVAALALMTSRVTKARMEVERPRVKRGSTRPPPSNTAAGR